MPTKKACIASIATGAQSTSRWRTNKHRAYPSDPRNAAAAELLDQIAEDAEGMTDAEWQRLAPFYSWESQSWRSALSLTTRQIGFSRHPRNFTAFVENLLDALNQPVAA